MKINPYLPKEYALRIGAKPCDCGIDFNYCLGCDEYDYDEEDYEEYEEEDED